MATYIPSIDAPEVRVFIEDLDGVSWREAPIPRRWHRCWAQTRGVIGGDFIMRCACGAIRRGQWVERPLWIGRNVRRAPSAGG